MSTHTQARLRIMKTLDAQGDLTVILDATGSPSSRFRARFLGSSSDHGIKIELPAALGPGIVVSVAGDVQTDAGRVPVLGKYRVCTCLLAAAGKYQAQLASCAKEAPSPKPPPSTPAEDLDCYEVLQVSRTADTDMVHRVFHVLAQRYHSDNRETGNEETFRRVVEAHRTLTDPELRAAHDVKLAADDKTRLRIFDSLESTQGVAAEVRKRQGVLRLLYAKRLSDPHNPSMRGRDFAEMLGCPVEHLEFSLWFLRENKLLTRTDNNLFEITCQGVEAFEASEANYGKKTPLTLPAPAMAG